MRSYFLSAIAIAIIAPATLSARSDDIPNLDVRPVCRGIASQSASNPADVGIKTTFEQCVQSEQEVREQLKKEWSTFSAADKQHCVGLAKTGGESSNTELLTCLEMARDVRALRSAETASSKGTTGQAPSLPSAATVQPAPADSSASRSPSAKEPAKTEVDSTLKELQRVKADAQNARTDEQKARASEAALRRKRADTEADLKRAKEEAARATKEGEQAKTKAKDAQEAKTEAERKLADAEAARSAAEEHLKAGESAGQNQRGIGAWLRRWFGHKPSNQ
jgi:DNA repair exonuclease SbcCD ATPase subunit